MERRTEQDKLHAARGPALRRQARLGLAVALMILTLWGLVLGFGLAAPSPLELGPAWSALVIALMTYLYTGLFITAHDAMHGLVFPTRPRINDAIGSVCCWLYALFSFESLRQKHRAHHRHPTQVGEDPDYHDGEREGFWGWYLAFMRRYLSLRQLMGMAIIFNVLHHGLGLGLLNLLLFWVLPSMLSTFQLFYFGTYLPHQAGPGHVDRHGARSNDYATWLSMLTCYHFGYHWEHHAYPFLPWWRLPKARER